VADDLDAEALAQSEEVEIKTNDPEGSVRTRVVRAEHLAALCLRVGRPKDLIRITQFLDENAVDIPTLCGILRRHNLQRAWQAFCSRAGMRDPCDWEAKI
jgi:hypothetical protein